jgi:hypothetical protein
MAFKPNYRQERAARTRSQETRKQEKLRRREENSAKRKALREGESTRSEPESDKS